MKKRMISVTIIMVIFLCVTMQFSVYADSSIPLTTLSSKVAILSTANNRYVCAEGGGGDPLIANRAVIDIWEKFELVDLGANKVAIKSYANNKYVCADNSGNNPLKASETQISQQTTFELIKLANNKVAFRSMASNKYVCSESAGASWMVANRTAIASWETFEIVMVPADDETVGNFDVPFGSGICYFNLNWVAYKKVQIWVYANDSVESFFTESTAGAYIQGIYFPVAGFPYNKYQFRMYDYSSGTRGALLGTKTVYAMAWPV